MLQKWRRNCQPKQKNMRREDRRISEQEAVAILAQGAWGVLSTCSKAQGPYGVPLYDL
jgi:nitroimidazol reductase NimA-like FMN-containing flavoprotein (pyridoxamine 5'-phosphate oxidase superfamily)